MANKPNQEEQYSKNEISDAAEVVAQTSPALKAEHTKREPLFHIVKRAGITTKQTVLTRAIAIVAALLFCGIVTVILTGANPFKVYGSIVMGAVGSVRRVWNLLQNTMMLLCVAIAVTPAFKMRFWNIGAEGQVLIGGLATAACMFYLGGKIPDGLLIPFMLISALAAGALWGVIPAIFKAKWNTNETLFTLMMNYVAMQLVAFFILTWDKSGSATIGPNKIPNGWLPEIFGQKYLLNILIVAIATAAMYVYLKYSKQGYEISVVGESEKTARYVGINVKKVIIRTMIISGAVCGLTGFLLVSGTDHSIATNTAGGRGFTAIMVSWLAKFNPLYMILTALLITFLGVGAEQISLEFRLNSSLADILTGIILFFIIGCEFFINYKLVFRKKGEEA